MKTCKQGHVREDSVRACQECNREYHRIRYALIKDAPEEILKRKTYRAENRGRLLEISRLRGRRGPGGRRQEYLRVKQKRPLLSVYRSMVDRCFNLNNRYYADYGGRGILVDKRWLGKSGYETFVDDMGPKPTPRHTLDRENNDLGYSPENCRWATRREQGANTRAAVKITLAGRTQCQAEWARELGISSTAFLNRIRRGWPEERLLTPGRKSGYLSREQRLEASVRRLLDVIGDSDFDGREEIEGLLRGDEKSRSNQATSV